MKKILVANRGEVAVRIIQACKELEINTVAVYSAVDKNALHTNIAEEAYQIGEGPADQSYLRIDSILELAIITRCDAIHPGYGFLSENIEFRKRCDEENIIFIGPSTSNFLEVADKLNAKKIAKRAGLPVVPGGDHNVNNEFELIETTETIGFPIILKATGGGGGKGIKVCRNREETINNYRIIRQEAEKSFGDNRIYVEKYIEHFRHIEVQIIGDAYGSYIHLGERLCSIQRNMQKIIEETPAPGITDNMREEMCKAAVKLAKTIGYLGVGTVEFIYDYTNEDFYFMEMNTRLQVEHPVTEMVWGIDIVKEQIQIACEKKLSVGQDDLQARGCAIECRINAENAFKEFQPCCGKIDLFVPPTGSPNIRVDTYIYSGYQLSCYYDSMIGKIIVYGNTRIDAINKMKVALKTTIIEGIDTTLDFLLMIMNNVVFEGGGYDNKFLEEYLCVMSETSVTLN